MGLLAPGDRVRLLNNGRHCVVRGLLGEGGQGEVWEVEVEEARTPNLALKWFQTRCATKEQWDAIHALVDIGPPTDRFLWPLDVADDAARRSFGYVMALRGPTYRGLADLLRKKVNPSSRSLASASLQLVDSFYQLHSKGLCYRDISFGNAFFDFDAGTALICDNDNVGVDGKAPPTVIGTPGFIAPEILRGEGLPSTTTDLYSLAVMLFYMFMLHHPLVGRKELEWTCMDEEAWLDLTAMNPIFIFDPEDSSNEPVEGLHDNALLNWPTYPQFFRQLFVQAFTDGIRDPLHGRVREGEWRRALARLRDLVFPCSKCGQENFLDPTSRAKSRKCCACGARVAPGATIRLGRDVIVLNRDTKLYPHHLLPRHAYDFSAPLAEVTRHPSDGRWGLRNLSSETWVVTTSDGERKNIPKDRALALQAGAKIKFGAVEGELPLA